MKEVVYDNSDEMVAWAESISENKYRDDARAIGLRDESGYRGVVIFDSFTTTGCWIHVVSDGSRRWLTREFILRVFAYPFIQCKFPRINAFVSELNRPSIEFCEGFGWQLEGILREAGAKGEDLFVFGMLRRECRWLPERFAGKLGRKIV